MNRHTRALMAIVLVAAGTLARASLRAAPNVVATNTTPRVREIGANYFDLLRQSQVWVNLEPVSTEPGPAPILLNVTVAFPGRELKTPPRSVRFRAQTPCFPVVFPQRVRQPILRFALNGAATLDLTVDGAPYDFTTSCGGKGASADTVAADAPFDMLRQMTAETTVGVEALGFSARLTAADLAALRAFTRTVASGAEVR